MKRLIAATVLVILAGAALALTGCATTGGKAGGDAPTGAAAQLVGTIWQIEYIDVPDQPTLVINDPEHYILQLQKGNRVGVRADCVTCVGSYDAGGYVLQMQLDCPQVIGCGPGSEADLFLDQLEQVNTFELKAGRLRLYNLDSSSVLTFTRVLQFKET